MSIDSKGIGKDKNTATFSSTFAGIPADFSLSSSKSSAKENTFSLGFTLKTPNPLKTPFSLKMPSSLNYTQSESGSKKVEIKSGAEIKIGEKSGIKLFSNADFGISF